MKNHASPKASHRKFNRSAPYHATRLPATTQQRATGTAVTTHFMRCSVSNHDRPEKTRLGTARATKRRGKVIHHGARAGGEGEIIGPGGKTIHKIVAESGCKIDIEDDGSLFIIATDEEGANKARFLIESILADVEVGKVYTGTVKRIMDFGAFVEIIPGVLGSSGKEGLVHISQLDETRVAKVEDVVKVGDKIDVKVTEIDRQGRVNLSRKAVLKMAKSGSNPS